MAVEFVNFGKAYGSNRLFDSVNLSLREQKISFIMAPNGAGKTTLIKCILGLERYEGHIVSGGDSIVSGGDSLEYSAVMRGRVLTVWDDCPFYRNMTGWQNLKLLAECPSGRKKAEETSRRKASRRAPTFRREIPGAAEEFLPSDILRRRVSSYSYGQKKKLALALAQIRDPEVLIMDEISNGLDYETMVDLKRKLRRWAEEKTVILTGHQFGFYNDLVDDVYWIRNRRLELAEKDFSDSGETLEELYEREMSHS